MQITLPPEAQAIIDREIESGRFNSTEEVIVEALIQFNQDQDSTYIPNEYLIGAREQAARGDAVRVTDELRHRIRENVRAAHERGDAISDDVAY